MRSKEVIKLNLWPTVSSYLRTSLMHGELYPLDLFALALWAERLSKGYFATKPPEPFSRNCQLHIFEISENCMESEG
jgi:hypothetical protein